MLVQKSNKFLFSLSFSRIHVFCSRKNIFFFIRLLIIFLNSGVHALSPTITSRWPHKYRQHPCMIISTTFPTALITPIGLYRCIEIFFTFSFLPAKNRTSSPSSTSLHQPTNIGSEIAVSSLKLKRETSPTVCCYNINSRSQSVGESHQSEKYFERFAIAKRAADDRQPPKGDDASVHPHKSLVRESVVAERTAQQRENIGEIYYLKDKIRRFENPPNNIQENIINRSTTTTKLPRSEESTAADVDPVKSVSEDDQRICDDDKNSRFGGKVFINRYESQSNPQQSDVKCTSRFANDDNNNKVRAQQTRAQSDSTQSSLIDSRQLPRTKDRRFNGDNTKVTKVVIRHLAPLAVKKKSQVDTESPPVVQKQSSFDDNDFSFIDSSSRSVSRSSSYSFASDELGQRDENVNCGRKARIPKITRINCNYSRGGVGVRVCANQNIYSPDQSKQYPEYETKVRQPAAHLIETLEKPNNLQQQKPLETFTPSPFSNDQTNSENLVSNRGENWGTKTEKRVEAWRQGKWDGW